MSQQPPCREHFEVAIICALPLEYDAVVLLFDELWGSSGKSAGDPYNYITGRIGMHNVLLVLLPPIGEVNVASAMASIRSSYEGLSEFVFVGICSGMPFNGQDEILLGDVIISSPVVRKDFRRIQSRFMSNGTKENAHRFFMMLRKDITQERLRKSTARCLRQLQRNAMSKQAEYKYPGPAEDKLFESSYRHKHHKSMTCICSNFHGQNDTVCDEALASSCDDLGCEEEQLVVRKRLKEGQNKAQQPTLHIGAVASGNILITSGEDRDRLAEEQSIIAFDMERPWIWEDMPCISIKGVCDYADCHKNDQWQNYAAATAASTLKAILDMFIPKERGHHQVIELPRSISFNSNFFDREFSWTKRIDPNVYSQAGILLDFLGILFPDRYKNGLQRIFNIGLGGVGKTQIASETRFLLHDKQLDSLAVRQMGQGLLEEAEKLRILTKGARGTKLDRQYQHLSSAGGLIVVGELSRNKSALLQAIAGIPFLPILQNVTVIDATSSAEKVEGEDDMLVQSDDDIRSVVSEGDDIGSQISDTTANEGMAGKALIRSFLTEQPQFMALCEKALAKMNRQRFVRNMTRLLKSFHICLAEEAKSEAEEAIAQSLRSMQDRREISLHLAAHIDMQHAEAQGDKIGFESTSLEGQNIIFWILQAKKPLAIEDLKRAAEQDRDRDRDQDQDNDAMKLDSEDVNDPYILKLTRFLLESRAFQKLQTRFALMFLPADLGYVLRSIPKENIRLSQEQDASILNQFKTLVENATKVRWNWWPLAQRKRMLNPGESRLIWRCTCGVEQWEEISLEQLEAVKKILDWSDDCPPLASRCGVRKAQVTIFSSIKGILQYTGAQVARHSAAATRYTPQEGSSHTLPESQRQNLSGAVPNCQQQGPTISQQSLTQVPIPDATNNQQWWILLGIKGARRTLVPTQIHVTSQTTDSHIFQELKRFYRIYRGRLRLWFSIWRLDYCEVVKFSRLTVDRMVREHRDLPSDEDYHYDPRAGERDVRNPPISPHHFQTLFYACYSPCTWPFPHDCIPLSANTANLARIPKRTREFERDQSSPIWGFETVFAVSFSYVLAYHLIMVAGPFIFWGLWLKFHPDDLQNASVPITVVIGALSLFWSGAGILTSRERE